MMNVLDISQIGLGDPKSSEADQLLGLVNLVGMSSAFNQPTTMNDATSYTWYYNLLDEAGRTGEELPVLEVADISHLDDTTQRVLTTLFYLTPMSPNIGTKEISLLVFALRKIADIRSRQITEIVPTCLEILPIILYGTHHDWVSQDHILIKLARDRTTRKHIAKYQDVNIVGTIRRAIKEIDKIYRDPKPDHLKCYMFILDICGLVLYSAIMAYVARIKGIHDPSLDYLFKRFKAYTKGIV